MNTRKRYVILTATAQYFVMAGRSEAWQYLDKVDKNKAKCKFCKQELACAGGNTSGPMRHVRSKHPTMLLGSAAKSIDPQPKVTAFTARPISESRSETITNLICDVIGECMLAISVVDAPSFTKLMAFVEPSYKVPCRQTMTKRLEAQQERLKSKVKEEMTVNKATKVTLTTDIWTSLTNEAYLSVTTSYVDPQWRMRTPVLATVIMDELHTADYISQCLVKTTDEWTITDQVMAVVHDGASNMREAGQRNNWKDIGCAAHKLHLVVSSALGIDKVTYSTIAKCVAACSRLVGHFSHSALATSELMKRQRGMEPDKTPRKLIQFCKTRWNSVFDMFQRLFELRWPVTAVLSDRSIVKLSDAKTLDMRDEHWQLIDRTRVLTSLIWRRP